MSSTEAGSSPPSSISASSPERRLNKRIGYIKPHTQPFSRSASNRSSVLALGRIDHLQHHFARAEKLTGRNASPDQKKSGLLKGRSIEVDVSEQPLPTFEEDGESEEGYIHPMFVPLPPSPIRNEFVKSVRKDIDPNRIRKELTSQLSSCSRQLSSLVLSADGLTDPSQNVVDLVNKLITCIRAARTYSTSVPLYQSRRPSFSVFREDALEILAQLRKILERDGAGGLSDEETVYINSWLDNVSEYLDDEDLRSREQAMTWMDNRLWEKASGARICSFLRFYDPSPDMLSGKTIKDNLDQFRTGLRLCQIYNAMVERSHKPFGLITMYHEDTEIRYRILENLRFWRAAITYRFDVHLESFDLQEIHDLTEKGREDLHQAVLQFSQVAMKEMIDTIDSSTLAEDDEEEEIVEHVGALEIRENA